MKKVLKETLALGFGLSTLTQEKVTGFVKGIMKSQGITEKEAKKLAKEMIKTSKETEQKVFTLLMDAAGSLFHAAGLATKADIEDLKKEIRKKKTKKKAKKAK